MTVTADLDVGAPRWHRDPGDPRHITYWNGARWTVHMRWDGAGWQRCEEPHEPPPVPTPALAHMVIGDPPAAPVAASVPPVVTDEVPAAEVVAETAPVADAAPGRRRHRRLVAMLVVLVVVAGAAAGYYVLRHRSASSPSGTLAPPAGSSALSVLDRSLAAARTDGSVHLVTTESAGSVSVTGTEDLALHVGEQTIGGSVGNATVVATPGAVYLKADAGFLQSSLGVPGPAAAKAAGTWVVFHPSDPGYSQIATGVTLGSALLQATPTGVLRLGAPEVLDGVRVVGITGGLPRDSVSGAVGQQVLYVEAAAPFLPVELDITGTLQGQRGTSTVAFSHWGEPVTPAVPTGTTPASSLGT
ncbi:MAG: hypothetical protein KGJ77_00270 [Acidobacteriota bacterium]|nr:hypothetical protein [Acidobacteriota bacterium]